MSYKNCVFDNELIISLKLTNQFEISKNTTPIPLSVYTTFKSIGIDEINNLRLILFVNKKVNIIWSNKILKFLEIRLPELNERLKLNYESYENRSLFKQYLISFLLESFYYSQDYRFLNIALKITPLRVFFKKNQNFYNKKLINFLKSKI
jgi:3'-phosphoadenosine 5'-phosphosulfate sulfotransferase (PAPS reductase)/FAD synthetase